MSDTPDIIWNNRVDETYPVEVIRTGEYSGMLRVWGSEAKDGLLHQQNVTLAYAARFGPDVADVNEWQNIACDVIDNPDKRQVPEL